MITALRALFCDLILILTILIAFTQDIIIAVIKLSGAYYVSSLHSMKCERPLLLL